MVLASPCPANKGLPEKLLFAGKAIVIVAVGVATVVGIAVGVTGSPIVLVGVAVGPDVLVWVGVGVSCICANAGRAENNEIARRAKAISVAKERLKRSVDISPLRTWRRG
jgi:hypothetical protein